MALVTPIITDAEVFAPRLAEAVAAGDVAAVLLRLAVADERTTIGRVKALGPAVQDHGAALILYDLPDAVGRSGADGAHLVGLAALDDHIGNLQPGRIAGVGAIISRHDAMLAGEAGADYVMFGGPEADAAPAAQVAEQVAWWAEVFQLPCIGYAADLAAVAHLAAAGADFVALGEWAFATDDAAACVMAAQQAMIRPKVNA